MHVLLVEDNKAEQVLIKEAFKEAAPECRLSFADDGVEALAFLNQEGIYSSAPTPNLIVLDLNLPKKSGREVLREIREHKKYEHTPILIFSNSEFPRDICECYALRVNAYLNKPSGFQGFVDFAHVVSVFWLKLVRYCGH
jgi:two-component system, chemotaxis family, response regulator Rcp1